MYNSLEPASFQSWIDTNSASFKSTEFVWNEVYCNLPAAAKQSAARRDMLLAGYRSINWKRQVSICPLQLHLQTSHLLWRNASCPFVHIWAKECTTHNPMRSICSFISKLKTRLLSLTYQISSVPWCRGWPQLQTKVRKRSCNGNA